MNEAPLWEQWPIRVKRCGEGATIYNVNDEYIGRSLDTYGEISDVGWVEPREARETHQRRSARTMGFAPLDPSYAPGPMRVSRRARFSKKQFDRKKISVRDATK